jgi:hypothetical protein
MSEIIGKECRFVVHVPSEHPDVPDVHLIKEVIHYSDKTKRNNLRKIENFQRTFYSTKKRFRNHSQKKTWEHLDKLDKHTCTESQLRNKVAQVLEMRYSNKPLKELLASPYIYGTDVSSLSIIKKSYMDKFPDLNTPYTVATLDIESNVFSPNKEILMITSVMADKSLTVVTKDFISGISNPLELLQSKARKYIGTYLEKREMVPEFVIAEDEIDALRIMFARLHEWQPDILAIWNMNYDIPEILKALERHDVDPKTILCDPNIPDAYRVCSYKPGRQQQVTASGKVKPINPAGQWHTLNLTASFYVLDAMCTYKFIRLAQPEESSYKLDYILDKILGVRKLDFDEAKGYEALKWHQFLQKNYPLEYVIYNLFDALSMIELDEKTKDLSYTVGSSAASTEFAKFNSQPKKIADALYFFILKKGYVLGSVGFERVQKQVTGTDENEEDVDLDSSEEKEDDGSNHLGLEDWIMTLPSFLSSLGLPLIAEDPTIQTNIRCFVFDSDATAAYPSATAVCNVAKDTTKREIIDIQGIPEDVFRLQNLNFILGRTNSLEYCQTMFGMAKPYELLDLVD